MYKIVDNNSLIVERSNSNFVARGSISFDVSDWTKDDLKIFYTNYLDNKLSSKVLLQNEYLSVSIEVFILKDSLSVERKEDGRLCVCFDYASIQKDISNCFAILYDMKEATLQYLT